MITEKDEKAYAALIRDADRIMYGQCARCGGPLAHRECPKDKPKSLSAKARRQLNSIFKEAFRKVRQSLNGREKDE